MNGQKVVKDAEVFVKQLEVLGYDRKLGRFDRQLSTKELLTYRSRLDNLIDSVNSLSSEEEQ